MSRAVRERVLIDQYNAAILEGDRRKANIALGNLIDFVASSRSKRYTE